MKTIGSAIHVHELCTKTILNINHKNNMKSYSDAVADTSKVQEVEQRLTEALSKQDEAQNARLGKLETDNKFLRFRANMQSILLALIVITDIVRYGF